MNKKVLFGIGVIVVGVIVIALLGGFRAKDTIDSDTVVTTRDMDTAPLSVESAETQDVAGELDAITPPSIESELRAIDADLQGL